jgi:hypothetical protein
MRKLGSSVCKLRPCLVTESTVSARIRTIVSAALQQQYSQTDIIFWITIVVFFTPFFLRLLGPNIHLSILFSNTLAYVPS